MFQAKMRRFRTAVAQSLRCFTETYAHADPKTHTTPEMLEILMARPSWLEATALGRWGKPTLKAWVSWHGWNSVNVSIAQVTEHGSGPNRTTTFLALTDIPKRDDWVIGFPGVSVCP
jgi:hypothetical protein